MSLDDAPSDVSALRPLSPDEAALVARFPLPAGVPDAVVNKYQLAAALAVSQNTLDNWRRAGLPAETEGTNGRSYEFRLSVCYAWNAARKADEDAARRRSEEATQALTLALLGGESVAGDRPVLSVKEQRDLLEAEAAYMVAARNRRELIPADDVAEALEAIFATFRDGLDALPDRLAREVGLDGRGVEAAVAICDSVLRAAQREIGDLFPGSGKQ